MFPILFNDQNILKNTKTNGNQLWKCYTIQYQTDRGQKVKNLKNSSQFNHCEWNCCLFELILWLHVCRNNNAYFKWDQVECSTIPFWSVEWYDLIATYLKTLTSFNYYLQPRTHITKEKWIEIKTLQIWNM